MTSFPVSAARDQLPAVLEQAATEAVTLLRHGRPVAVVLSPARYEALLEAEEELDDVAAFDEALAETSPTIPWEQVRADLGWL
ncbi:type II toxin-antitoxin system prevent-host-death family antitoxin [Nocardioides perillae]|uniref:Antitoxin n=1 Tax=Nocardioides perillae TaxID=1119534 RepID=A0A7Y9RWP1_9ACTN|nr:prevent-host-death family protein [Nocardioides perillae]